MFQVQEWKCKIICLHSNLLFLNWLYVTSLCFIYRYVYNRLFIFYLNISHLYIVPMFKRLIIKIICTIECFFILLYLRFFLTYMWQRSRHSASYTWMCKDISSANFIKIECNQTYTGERSFIEIDAIKCKYLKYVELQFGMLQFKDCIGVNIHALCT